MLPFEGKYNLFFARDLNEIKVGAKTTFRIKLTEAGMHDSNRECIYNKIYNSLNDVILELLISYIIVHAIHL